MNVLFRRVLNLRPFISGADPPGSVTSIQILLTPFCFPESLELVVNNRESRTGKIHTDREDTHVFCPVNGKSISTSEPDDALLPSFLSSCHVEVRWPREHPLLNNIPILFPIGVNSTFRQVAFDPLLDFVIAFDFRLSRMSVDVS